MKYGIRFRYPDKSRRQVIKVILIGLGFLLSLTGCSTNKPVVTELQEKPAIQQNLPKGTVRDTRQDSAGPKTAAVPVNDQSQPVVPRVSADFFKAIPILYYHSVMLEPGNELRMPPEEFGQQMAYLSEHGYHSITPEELEHFLSGQGELPFKPFLITFDDGYADNYLNALPILRKYKFTATVFMVSSYIDGKGFLSLEQLHRLIAAGWTIGGHTVNHVDLTKVDPDSLKRELLDSKVLLEKDLSQPVRYFAYPYGAYDSRVEKMLQETGYSLAFTTERGWANQGSAPLLIHRIYCFASMGMPEFERRLTNPRY